MIRIEKIAKAKPFGIILREKDLTPEQYEKIAVKVIEICNEHNTQCILHNFPQVAISLNHKAIHLPLTVLRKLSDKDRKKFNVIGASCHSVEDGIEAQALGCSYITAGHVFATDCKKGLPGRGVEFIENISKSVSIPVYAIGGIAPENASLVLSAGARGVCIMSQAMTSENVEEYLGKLK